MSHFKGYKNTYNGIAAFAPSSKVVFSHSLILDNAWGMVANPVPSGSEYDDHTAEIRNNVIYGSSISDDCPDNGNGGFCFKKDKLGYTVGVAARGGKSQFLTEMSPRPFMKIKADATWAGKNVLLRNVF